MNGLDDEQLMVLLKDGDHQAFDLLFERHQKRLMGYLVKKLGSTTDADEAFQKTFEKIYTKAHLFNPEFKFSPWLFTIALNSANDIFRKKKKYDLDEDIEIPDTTNRIYNPIPDLPLEKLSTKSQAALEMRYWNEETYLEISKKLKISEVSARQVVSRAIKQVRTILLKENKK